MIVLGKLIAMSYHYQTYRLSKKCCKGIDILKLKKNFNGIYNLSLLLLFWFYRISLLLLAFSLF